MRGCWGPVTRRSARRWGTACVLLLGCDASGAGDVDAAFGDTGAHETGAHDAGTLDSAAGPEDARSTPPSPDGEGGPTTDEAQVADAGTRHDAAHADASSDAADASTTPAGCAAPGLMWKSAKKTNYESYPAPGSDECVKYHGCDYLGQFQACKNTMPESWVKTHDIASVYPLTGLSLHRLCVRAGTKTIVVTAIDTCSDSDCSGCCTQNRGNADRLIDLEKYTDQRFSVADGDLEWADLGAGDPSFDGCN